ncbi:MAG: OsmC family protein [Cellulomonas sp.]
MTVLPVPQPAALPRPTDTWAERTGARTYTGRNARGAEVLMGPSTAGAVFTPGELLKVALAGCCGMSSDLPLARRLGPDYAATVRVTGASDEAEDRYPHLHDEIVVDLSSLEDAALARLLTVIQRAVDENCTVARTLLAGATVDLTVTNETPTDGR